MSIMPEGLLTEARALQPQLLADRRQLHAHPEVGPDLPQTREYVARRLREMGYDPRPLAGGLTADMPATLYHFEGADAAVPFTLAAVAESGVE